METSKINTGVFLSSSMKHKIITVLKWAGLVLLANIIVEALLAFMWLCYYAGVPM